ncbi:MAG TPA: glycerol-3-phosphate acyltransferase [Roseiflexaceae bacterium]|nr:glycerol-3-phosphate acyltransferase [Roseiflexaceae bacterium]
MAIWRDLVAIIVAYLLGCIATAYYLVRLRTGQDIRQLGSGNVGGRNAGRVLGKAGFVLVAVGDALKGLLAVLFARYLGVGGWSMLLVILAVVAGHIWPAQLGFKGGKGAATLMGALIGYNIVIALLIAGIFVLLFVFLRSFTLAGMLALGLTPFALLILGQPRMDAISVAAPVLLVIFAHRANLRAILQGRAGASQPARPLTRRGE